MSKAKEPSDTTEAPIPGALFKPVLSGHKKYKASRVRYAVVKEDGTFAFCFTASKPGSESGKNYTRQCTKHVYERVYGRHPGSDIERTPVGGYSGMTGRTFYVYENKETGIVEAVSVGPGYFYNSKQAAPVVLKDQRSIDTIFYPESGSFEIQYIRGPENDWQLPSIPGDMKALEYERLVTKVDDAKALYPGQQITGDFVVTTVAGNRVSFSR